jgi:hypothetical protein
MVKLRIAIAELQEVTKAPAGKGRKLQNDQKTTLGLA